MIYTILLLGSKGQLGHCLRAASIQNHSPHHFLHKDIEDLDITKKGDIFHFFEKEKIDIIINCAAYTAVDQAEDEVALAHLVNETAVSYLAEIAQQRGIYFIHISTDYVFDGRASQPYRPDDLPNPQSVYGESKLAGERAMLSSGCRGCIIRTSWLYSGYGHNFVKTMLKIGEERSELRVVNDQFGSPTNANDLAKAILAWIDRSMSHDGIEICHFSNRGSTTWYEFAKEIFRLAGYQTTVIPVCSDEYPTKAKRPHYSVLDLHKIEKCIGYSIPFWQESLEETVRELL